MKKIILAICCLILVGNIYAQTITQEQFSPIIERGKIIYKLEMANWTANKLINQKYKGKEKVAGSISYLESDKIKTVYYTKTDKYKSLAIFTMDESFDEKNIQVDLVSRVLTNDETDLIQLKSKASKELEDTKFFAVASDAKLSLVPYIGKGVRDVYVMSESTKEGVVIFGDDYVLSYNNDFSLSSKIAYHANVAAVTYEIGAVNTNDKMSSHTAIGTREETISPIDIATLFLYEKATKWRQHSFISEKYIFFWNYDTKTIQPLLKAAPPSNK